MNTQNTNTKNWTKRIAFVLLFPIAYFFNAEHSFDKIKVEIQRITNQSGANAITVQIEANNQKLATKQDSLETVIKTMKEVKVTEDTENKNRENELSTLKIQKEELSKRILAWENSKDLTITQKEQMRLMKEQNDDLFLIITEKDAIIKIQKHQIDSLGGELQIAIKSADTYRALADKYSELIRQIANDLPRITEAYSNLKEAMLLLQNNNIFTRRSKIKEAKVKLNSAVKSLEKINKDYKFDDLQKKINEIQGFIKKLDNA